jgi:hypothetical protein
MSTSNHVRHVREDLVGSLRVVEAKCRRIVLASHAKDFTGASQGKRSSPSNIEAESSESL